MSDDLTLQRIRDIGGFSAPRTELREVTWIGINPETGRNKKYTHTVEVRRMSFLWTQRTLNDARKVAEQNDWDECERERHICARLVSGGVLFGGVSLPFEEAILLEDSLLLALTGAFNDVNKVGQPIESEESAAKN